MTPSELLSLLTQQRKDDTSITPDVLANIRRLDIRKHAAFFADLDAAFARREDGDVTLIQFVLDDFSTELAAAVRVDDDKGSGKDVDEEQVSAVPVVLDDGKKIVPYKKRDDSCCLAGVLLVLPRNERDSADGCTHYVRQCKRKVSSSRDGECAEECEKKEDNNDAFCAQHVCCPPRFRYIPDEDFPVDMEKRTAFCNSNNRTEPSPSFEDFDKSLHDVLQRNTEYIRQRSRDSANRSELANTRFKEQILETVKVHFSRMHENDLQNEKVAKVDEPEQCGAINEM